MNKITVAASILIVSSGYCIAQTATTPVPTTKMDADQKTHFVSDIYDQSIYDKSENKIGKIDNLVVDKDGKISSVIVGVGGFLGMGQKDVEIPYTDINMVSRDGKNWLEVDRSKDQLQSAPSFDMKTSNNP
jgi:sporulation protein YlmC with PRC-barrel domain